MPGSTTEQALQLEITADEAKSARVQLFGGAKIVGRPHYAYCALDVSEIGRAFIKAVREAVGLIGTAYGCQATGSTLATLCSIVHAPKGWPTPLGAAIKSGSGLFVDGKCTDQGSAGQLDLVGRQVVEFACLRAHLPSATSTGLNEYS